MFTLKEKNIRNKNKTSKLALKNVRRLCFASQKIVKNMNSLHFREDNNNDITPYGEWYGMNDSRGVQCL